MLDLVHEIQLSRTLTIIYVTHIAAEIPRLATRVAMMQDGRITETLSVEMFLERQKVAPECRG